MSRITATSTRFLDALIDERDRLRVALVESEAARQEAVGEVVRLSRHLLEANDRTERLTAAILDIDAHATPFGEDEDGFVTGGYLVSVGSIHRALGIVGRSAAKCRDIPCERATAAEAARNTAEQDADRLALVVDANHCTHCREIAIQHQSARAGRVVPTDRGAAT